MKTKRQIALLTSIIILIAVVLAGVCTITYAVWTKNATAEKEVELDVDKYNPSEKYIVFQGLNSQGELTLNAADIVSFAVVGYSGLIAEVKIPSTHENFPVTKICVSDTEFDCRLNGNPVITSLVIPESVTEITAGACANMSLLNSVTIEGTTELTIGALAFANCPNLTKIDTARTVIGDNYLI